MLRDGGRVKIMVNNAPLVESHVVTDIFAAGLAEVEELGGGCLRFTFYTKQTSLYTREVERVVVARIVLPTSAVPEAIAKTLTSMGQPVTLETVGNGTQHH